MVKNNFGTKTFGMRLHTLHELRALNAIGITGPVVYISGCG